MDDDVVPAGGGSRSLKTAATVLRALRLLGDHPDGLSATDLAEELGKSAATARYMINTLCEAGYAERASSGRCRLSDAPPWGQWGTTPASPVPGDPDPGAVLAEATTELYRRTRQRSYLVRRTGTVVATVTDSRGHQGLAKHPGLGTHVAPDHAHALAMTKVLLATSAEYREAVDEEGDPLTRLTPATLTDLPALRAELDEVRRRGVALDREEFAEGFASIAAPVVSPSGAATVALGLSCSARRLALDEDELVEAVRAVAARASAHWAGEIGARPVGMPPARPDETVERDAPAARGVDELSGFSARRR
ncbi:IclR family transcriptional regulator C-terminal domain-containing protein [Actinomycetospora lutea]|uniref:IclR family transcriptional regulator n=1 Tax=Actinomycetospora lutea TaxID=663604 RepID=UPI002365E1E4|nr:IclR family transcriptional regulator C-terminal domain-containing protein [Actinomycetospora lutea]MDD7938000.1 IclR family transcriptional regulator C-terminal domain-containing protein [Actinomycetospora lutea]